MSDSPRNHRKPAGLIFCAFFTIAAIGLAGTYSGGTGTPADPYKISKVADWQELITTSVDCDKSFVLTEDLDFDGVPLSPVGGDSTEFTGIFEGQDHIFRNAILNHPSGSCIGLFGILGSSGQVRNLGVENVNSTGTVLVGGLSGVNWGTITNCYAMGIVRGNNSGVLCGLNNYYGTISNCYAMGSASGTQIVGILCGRNCVGTISNCYATGSASGRESVGGLCGDNESGVIGNSYATGPVSGTDFWIGGLCGVNDSGKINNCYAAGTVSGTGSQVGGLCGQNWGWITNGYATGKVSGTKDVGGLCGQNWGWITNGYATGKVSGTEDVGGLCGIIKWGTISGCFWDVEVSGQAGSTGGEGKTTAEMKALATFTGAGWDFVGEAANGAADVWRMCGDGIDYPRLSWEFCRGGDMDCPNGVALEDVLYLAGRWMASTPATFGAADTNADGRVDLFDFAVMAENWMK